MGQHRSTGTRRHSRPRERGQAVVELALLLPLFLLLVFGMVEFGKALNYWIDMTHLANEGSRFASVNRWPGCAGDSGPCSDTLQNYVIGKANTDELRTGVAGGNVESPLEVAVCYPDGVETVGAPVRVAVRTSYSLNIVDGLLSAVGLDDIGDIEMEATSTMRMERRPTRIIGEETPCA